MNVEPQLTWPHKAKLCPNFPKATRGWMVSRDGISLRKQTFFSILWKNAKSIGLCHTYITKEISSFEKLRKRPLPKGFAKLVVGLLAKAKIQGLPKVGTFWTKSSLLERHHPFSLCGG